MTQSAETFALERGTILTPRFDKDGLICAVAQDATSRDVMMVAWMNAESLELTLSTGIAHYWSRSRGCIWKKGETSGQLQRVKAIHIDCDQDALVLEVDIAGDGGCCHVGFKSCFYRAVSDQGATLVQTEPGPPIAPNVS